MAGSVRCTSRKVSYDTEHDAESTRQGICEAMDAESSPKRRPIRSYQCDRCRMWHLTSQPMRTLPRLALVPESQRYEPTDPISPARTHLWRAVRAEVEAANCRERLERPFPWSTSRRSAAA